MLNQRVAALMARLRRDPFLAQRFKHDPAQRRVLLEETGCDDAVCEAIESQNEERIAKVLGLDPHMFLLIVVVVVPDIPIHLPPFN